jgi:HEAT repeat protein
MKGQMIRIFRTTLILLFFCLSIFSVVHSQTDQLERLIQNLNSEYRDLRMSAIWTLGRVKDPRAVEALINALRHKDPLMREKAAEALGETKDMKAVEPLIAMLKDEEETIPGIAAEALEKITGKNLGQNHDKWQKWWEQNKGTIRKGR